MKFKIFKAEERGLKDIGWLQSNFTFSFSNYYDPQKNGFGLLRVFNDDFVETKNGFGLHAHSNMEIVSIMLHGKMNHKDTLGYTEVVEKDWVQIMSAGSGLRHEEHNVGEEQVNFLQIWIEPKLQNVAPRYQKRYFPEEKRRNQLVTVVSNEEGQGHCWINQNAKISLGSFSANEEINYTFNPTNKAAFVFLMSGSIAVNREEIQKRDAIGIWQSDILQIQILQDSKFIIIEAPINH